MALADKDPPPQLVVTSAISDFDAAPCLLTLRGRNFRDDELNVRLGEEDLLVLNHDDNWAIAEFDCATEPGDYLLEVRRGPSNTDGDVLSLTLGAVGPRGPQGIEGPVGPEGPIGPQGPTGDTGPMGLQGTQGETGPQGVQGEAGPTGPTGQRGPVGPSGPAGAQGAQGAPGMTGPQGEPGPPGSGGVGPWSGPYTITHPGLDSGYEEMIELVEEGPGTFCFLSEMAVGTDNGEHDRTECQILATGGWWRLRLFTTSDDPEAGWKTCSALCIEGT